MPAWWDKISGRSKDSETKSENSVEGSSPNNEKKRGKENGSTEDCKVKSFEEVLVLPQSRNSPRNSRDFSAVGRSSGFSGFDSASSWDRGHPLPLPLEPQSDQPGHFHGVGFGLGSGSVSSVSSSGSSDDPAHVLGHNGFRGHVENRVLSPLSRSPGRGSRYITTGNSPIHARINGINLDSSNGKLEDGRNEGHKLPLPPGSPVSPSPLSTPRSRGTPESSGGISSKWRKGKLLGRGAFGHVYLGFNSENGQMCAIKEVRVVSDDQSSRESLKQLNQEIALLSQLSHPNIVQYYGSDLNEERLSVYLEYVSGGSIHKLLQEYGAFGEPVIRNYTRQILSGLAYLHGRNTVHRDIKGANILVDPNGEVKLADFGMAKHITTCSSMLSFKGSPYWMAPEVVMNTNVHSLPVDIWSLGCTVLEMATSRPPWSQYEGVTAIFKIGNSRDAPDIPDHLSADAKSFIRLCLQREPSARPTASQLLGHPFVRNQTTLRATNCNITREAFPRPFDGSHTPTALEMQSSRTNNSLEQDDASKFSGPRTFTIPRNNARTITSSLPVSPPSSPLRRDASQHKIFFLSPPHPFYTVGKSTPTHINNLEKASNKTLPRIHLVNFHESYAAIFPLASKSEEWESGEVEMPIEMPKGLPFSVDTWTPSSKRKRHHFLTHAHKDHAQGISAHASFPVYSTLFTRTLICRYYPQVDESMFVGIEIGQSLSVEDPDGDFTVTAFDANHCPGAVMFLFEGNFGNILHTGDCRLTPECLQKLPEKYIGKKGKEPLCPLDYIFLDCTFGQFPSKMPSRHEAIQQVINCIWKHPNASTVYLTCGLLGQEEILVQVSQTFGGKIYVDKIKNAECLKALEPTVPEILSQDPSSRFQLFDGFHRLYEWADDKMSEARTNFQHEPLIIRPSAQWYALNEGVSDTESRKKVRFDQAVRDLYGVWHVCYTIHSSRDELEWALELLAPKWVVSTTPSCRAIELDYVKKHCQRAFDDSLWKLLDFGAVESPDPYEAGKSFGCSNLMERIPNKCVKAQSEPVVISTHQRKRLSMSPPSKRPMLTLFGRARFGLQDSILQHEQNEIVSMSSDSLERTSTEEDRSFQKEKVIKVELQEPLESNRMADHELCCISSVGIEGTTITKFEEPLESERMANCEESKFTYATTKFDMHKHASISSIGFSRSYDENLRRFYRTMHVPIPQPLPSLVKLMEANKKMKKRI